MKKIEEKIFDYLDNRMSSAEKAAFRKELEQNAELKKRFQEIYRKLQSLNEFKNIEVNELYFNSLIPRLKTSERERKFYIIKPAYAAITMILIAFIATFMFREFSTSRQTVTFSQIEENLSAEELYRFALHDGILAEDISLAAEIDSGINQQIDELIENELFSESVQDYLTDNSDYLSLMLDISDSEAERIYTQLINKKIF
ncbi:MAG: hypothetical protein Kow0098_17270 [Ignavibacteriaceae bacterium]